MPSTPSKACTPWACMPPGHTRPLGTHAPLAHTPPGKHAPGMHAPPPRRMVNVQAVRILLECNLVFNVSGYFRSRNAE